MIANPTHAAVQGFSRLAGLARPVILGANTAGVGAAGQSGASQMSRRGALGCEAMAFCPSLR